MVVDIRVYKYTFDFQIEQLAEVGSESTRDIIFVPPFLFIIFSEIFFPSNNLGCELPVTTRFWWLQSIWVKNNLFGACPAWGCLIPLQGMQLVYNSVQPT